MNRAPPQPGRRGAARAGGPRALQKPGPRTGLPAVGTGARTGPAARTGAGARTGPAVAAPLRPGSARPRATGPRARQNALARRDSAQSRRKLWWLAALLLLLAFLWRRPALSPAPPIAKPAPAALKQPAHRGAAPSRDNDHPAPAPPALAAAKSKPLAAPPKKTLRAPPPDGISRDLLLAAVQARSPSLRACPLPPGAPARVSVRLRVARKGDLRTVQFVNAEPLPRPLAECLRTTLQKWSFPELPLKSDVEVLVDFLLGA